MNKCRVLNLPQCQYLSSNLINQQCSSPHPRENSDKMASKQRYGFCRKYAFLLNCSRKTIAFHRLILSNLTVAMLGA